MWGGAPRFPRRPPQRAKAPLPRFFLLIIFYQAFVSGDDFTFKCKNREVGCGDYPPGARWDAPASKK